MKKILVVDDELNMLLVLEAMLKKEKYEVATASDGLEALEILKDDVFWAGKILPFKLAVVNNFETEEKFYFYISNRLNDHIYLKNKKPPYYQVGYSTRSLFDQEKNYSDIIDMLRSAFIREINGFMTKTLNNFNNIVTTLFGKNIREEFSISNNNSKG